MSLKGLYSILVNKISGPPRKRGTGYAPRRSPSGTLYFQRSPKPAGPETAHVIFKWMQAISFRLDYYWSHFPRKAEWTDWEYAMWVDIFHRSWDALKRYKGCRKSTNFQCYKHVNSLRMLYCLPGLSFSPDPHSSWRIRYPLNHDPFSYPTLTSHVIWAYGHNTEGKPFHPWLGNISIPTEGPPGTGAISCPHDASERICPPDTISIQARHSPGGWTWPSGLTNHDFLSHPAYTWWSDPGYTYRRHYIDGVLQIPAAGHTFPYVIQDHDICVDFALDAAAPCPDFCMACCQQYTIKFERYYCNWPVPFDLEIIVTRIAPGSCQWRADFYHAQYDRIVVILYCALNTWIVYLRIYDWGTTSWKAYTTEVCPPETGYYTCVSGCRPWSRGHVTVKCVGEPPIPISDCPWPCGPAPAELCQPAYFPTFVNQAGRCGFLNCTNWNGRGMVMQMGLCHWTGPFRGAQMDLICRDSKWFLKLTYWFCNFDEWSADNVDGCPPVGGWTQNVHNSCAADVTIQRA